MLRIKIKSLDFSRTSPYICKVEHMLEPTLENYINHPSFLKIKDLSDKFELTMKAVRDKLHHGRYMSLDGKILETELYRVIFYKFKFKSK
jgi:hypothetical protein